MSQAYPDNPRSGTRVAWIVLLLATAALIGLFVWFFSNQHRFVTPDAQGINPPEKEKQTIVSQAPVSEEVTTTVQLAQDSSTDKLNGSALEGELAQVELIETELQESTPEEITPEEVTPEEVTPEEVTPEEVTPEEVTPEEATPEEATPEEVTPEEVTPEEVTPEEVTPEEVTPEEVTPEEVTPEEVTPEEVTPAEATPEAINSEAATPEVVTPVISNAEPGTKADAGTEGEQDDSEKLAELPVVDPNLEVSSPGSPDDVAEPGSEKPAITPVVEPAPETPLQKLRREELALVSEISGKMQIIADADELDEMTVSQLDLIFEYLFLYSETDVVVSVESNETSSVLRNIKLAQQRGDRIVEYLTLRGLARARFSIAAESDVKIAAGSHQIAIQATLVN